MSVLIARPTTSTSGGAVVLTTSYLPVMCTQKYIGAGNMMVLDSLPTSQSLGTKWYVVLCTQSGSKSRAVEMISTEYGGTVYHSEYGMVGDTILGSLTITIENGAYVLTCVNGEIEPIFAYTTRLYVPTSNQMTTNGNINIEHTTSVVKGQATGVLDVISKEHTVGVKWVVTFMDANSKRRTAQVFSLSNGGVGTVYGLLGDSHDDTILELINDTHTVSLGMINNLPTDIIVNTIKIPITPALPGGRTRQSDVDVWLPASATISPHSTAIVDGDVPIPGHAAVKWMVVAEWAAGKQTFEVMADRFKTETASHVRYGIIGDYIDIATSVSIEGMYLALSVQNNTDEFVKINTIRVPIAI